LVGVAIVTANNLLESDALIDVLSRAVKWGGGALEDVPLLLKRIISEERWQERLNRHTGEIVHFDSFADFVTAAPLEGLGADPALVKRMCSWDAEALELVDRALGGGGMANPDVTETRIDDALLVLSYLDSGAWLQLADLSQRHRAGRLSFDAWQCAAGALLERVAARIQG
jgi:hypothetical protein